MKAKHLHIILIGLVTFIMLCCDDEQPEAKSDNFIIEEAGQLIQLKTELDKVVFGLSALFKNELINGRKAAQLETCANVTTTQTENGAFTVVLDFGNGCTESGGDFLQGVVAFQGTNFIDTLAIGFENFAYRNTNEVAKGFTISGIYRCRWSTYPSDQFDYSEQFIQSFQFNYSEGTSEKLSAEGSFLANKAGFAVTNRDFQGTNNTGRLYQGLTVDPLIYKYDCKPGLFLKGTEVYYLNGEPVSIAFGNGDCDNVISIQINGTTIEYNF